MRLRLFAVLAAGCLAGCGTPNAGESYGINQAGVTVVVPPKQNWDISSKVDRLTDKTATTVMNTAKITKISSKSGFAASVLSLSCGAGGRSASVYYDFPVGTNGASVVSYRFDSLPSKSPKPDFLNMQMFSIRGSEAQTFFQQLSQASSLFIQVSSVTGVATSEFDVAGAGDAIASAMQDCPAPVPSALAPRRSKSAARPVAVAPAPVAAERPPGT